MLALIAVNFLLGRELQNKAEKVTKITSSPAATRQDSTSSVLAKTPSADHAASTGEVIRKTRVERGSDIIENVFYQNGKEIARQVITKEGKLEQTGTIPDGRVKFYDEYNNVYGDEHYEDGKKTALTKTYYSNGQLKSDEVYLNGKLRTIKEYYANGNLRFEGDYRNTRGINKDNTEVGIGKIYNHDGSLKYEWDMTTTHNTGFKKSYNRDGGLRAALYYDAQGSPIKNVP